MGVTIDLDGENLLAPRPLVYAIETFSDSSELETSKIYHLKSPGGLGNEELKLAITTKRRIHRHEQVFVRLKLHSGLAFRRGADPSLEVVGSITNSIIAGTNMSFDDRIQGGSPGSDQIVFKINVVGSDLGVGETVVFDLTDDLAVTRVEGTYAAEVSAHSNVDDAINGTQILEPIFYANADIVALTRGLSVRIFNVSRATAEVETGFLSFVGPRRGPSLTGQAKLGWVRVVPRQPNDSTEILNASTGETVQISDLVADNGVSIEVQGNLSLGAFRFIEDRINAAGARREPCPNGASSANPDRGTLVDDNGALLIDEAGKLSTVASGRNRDLDAHMVGDYKVYSLCVNVDYLGQGTNTKPIPNETYTGTVSVTGTAQGADPVEAGTAPIGKIERNGTAVKLGYLTASRHYDQQLVILNRGTAPALYVLGEFTTETGTTVRLSNEAEAARMAGLNVVPSYSKLVLSVSDLLTFSGERRRTTATLGLNAAMRDIQVATVQTNIRDGSSDTLVYPSEPGPGQ